MEINVINKGGIIYQMDGIESVVVSTINGELGILPGHTYLISVLQPGKIKVRKNKQLEEISLKDYSIMEVSPLEINIYEGASQAG